MRTIYGAAVVVIIACIASLAHGTCVFESDFGFAVNCNFKKSGLFRVRNLGGLKAYFGLGFSVGDELGFAESIGNVEGGRRRALNYRTGLPSNVGVLPANYQSNAPHNRNAQRMKMPPPNRIATLAPTYKRAVPHPAMLQGPSNGMTQVYPPRMTHAGHPLMTQAISPMMTQARPILLNENEPLRPAVPPFKPIPMPERKQEMQPRPFQSAAVHHNFTYMQTLPMKPISQNLIANEGFTRPSPVYRPVQSPSVSRISSGDIVEVDNEYPIQHEDMPKVDLMGHSVEELAAAANVSVEAIKYAIHMRQQQLQAERRRTEILRNKILQEIMATRTTTTTSTTTTTTTTTPAPSTTPAIMPTKSVTTRPYVVGQKVMNAPKEYYPGGYEKNFDDNFQSKVDLPPTNFHCGDQKHFPGLYADMDLGCMVFHVCALTDDGLIMKSFLCPESTLFDQTVLKCNWWFYVECKNSKDLYDSNIPISKSYQLMKSLSYFSNYKKSNAKDLEALENAVSGDENDNENKT